MSIDDRKLHALVDGELPPDEAQRLESQLSSQPDALAKVQAWRRQRALLQQLADDASPMADTGRRDRLMKAFDAVEAVEAGGGAAGATGSAGATDVIGATVAVGAAGVAGAAEADGAARSATASAAVHSLAAARETRRSTAAAWTKRLAWAATLAAVSWMGGWYSHDWRDARFAGATVQSGLPPPQGAAGAAVQGAARLAAVPAFVNEATTAYAVFTPEVRHPVEVGADQQDHLVQWLSRRLGRPLKLPDLAPAGFALLGGRLLPAAEGMGAQFLYQDPTGLRLALYLTVFGPGEAPGDTAFRYSDAGAAPTFYWVDRDFGYAVSARLPRERMLQIAQLVYNQTADTAPTAVAPQRPSSSVPPSTSPAPSTPSR